MNPQPAATGAPEQSAAVRLTPEQIAAIAAIVPMSPEGPQARVPISRVIDAVDRELYRLGGRLRAEVDGRRHGNSHETAAQLQRLRQGVALLKWLRTNGVP